MLLTVVLTWSLTNCCPVVEQARAHGMNDEQIEQVAHEYHVPKWIIAWAKRHCKKVDSERYRSLRSNITFGETNMNALALVEQDPHIPPFVAAVAIRMADEGIPVRVIARTTRLPSDEVYEILRNAVGRGAIVELPKDDWPVGSRRGSRTAFNGTLLETEDALIFACAQFFKATKLEASILAVLLKRNEVTKAQLHLVIEQNRPGENRDETDPKMVDVIICHLRKKLLPHDVTIKTVWGIGYLVPPDSRDIAMRILTQFLTSRSKVA